MKVIISDGGRAAAGYRGKADDCVCRAIAIATLQPYGVVYDDLNQVAVRERSRRGRVGMLAAMGRGSSARTGVMRGTLRDYLAQLGWKWTPTMAIGTGCKVHLRAEELPKGRLIVALSKHLTAVIDGTIFDTHDPSRGGTRCVYGYWSAP